ncbi:major facilitator superfamily protein, putative [Ichthyophthirius multifiliis]|uniref:Major facilitator superfamily protein, putative n=1 Tax=Ichthyophthirius multifiliis TaxID=5932 RepID=G0QZ96_ICHMU|nr:major facilitator superfamily protein, putative [Ichthyophthirius multifiliis]EGR29453.1 major facilitator superfamily protein, putative [Ichthyophthirius multifiliis]|eukprot:XP_004030689.1 major facilitator superfamily protein, putative [Ichthyophthirius multifiliis]
MDSLVLQQEYNNSSINNDNDQKQLHQISRFVFYFMIFHASFTNVLMAYHIGLFNNLSDHLDYIYSWNLEQKILYISLINSLPQFVAAIIALFGGKWAQKHGRRKLLIIFNYISVLGTGVTLIKHTYALVAGRIIIGFSFGIWSTIGPLYTLEVACKKYKGISGVIYSIFFCLGIAFSYIASYGLPSDPKQSQKNNFWRIILGIPAVLDQNEARKTLEKYYQQDIVDFSK